LVKQSTKHGRFDKPMTVTLLIIVSIIGCSLITLSTQTGLARDVSVAVSENSTIVRVHYIDVGQGDSILIDTPNRDVLIDGGLPDKGQAVLNCLSSAGVGSLYLMIATHVHDDHIGGLVTVLSRFAVDQVLINGQTSTSSTYLDFMQSAQSHVVTLARRGQTYTLAEAANLTVLNPTQPLQFDDANDNSIVVKLQVGTVSFLFAGDAQAAAEQSMLGAGLNLHCDVLKVGHHGSSTSTTQPFLDSVAPEYAIISVGQNNPYGHPSAETVQRLLDNGVITYTTSQSGTIVVSTDGTSLSFEDSPQPIPEIDSNILTLSLMMAIVTTAACCARKRSR
jgi:competence protein ComEC